MQGRPRILSSRQEKACIYGIAIGGKENASETVKELRESEEVNVNRWIVRRTLK